MFIYIVNINNLSKISERSGEWFDKFERETLSGTIIDFSYQDNDLGKWIIQLRVSPELNKIVVSATWSEKKNNITNQLHTKSLTLKTIRR